MQPHSGLHHPAALSAFVGALAGGALGTYGFIAFVLVAPPRVNVGVSHALFALLFITVPVPIGALVGWWQHERVLRVGRWCLTRSEAILERYRSVGDRGGHH